MQKQKQGHIINIASVAGFKVFAAGGTVYSATKFAVRAVTEGLRMEHRADNIRCTMISPGAVATELPESSSEEATRKNLHELYKNGYSGRLDRARDRLRHGATGRGGNRRGRHPAHGAGFLTWSAANGLNPSSAVRFA
jgi:NAD(P)-dependent dehydrogenase (short-subunit alcohol dehydrogenase family)